MHGKGCRLAVWLACLHAHAGHTDGLRPHALQRCAFAPPAVGPDARARARMAPAEPRGLFRLRVPAAADGGRARRVGSGGSADRLQHPKLPRLRMYGPLMEVGYKVCCLGMRGAGKSE